MKTIIYPKGTQVKAKEIEQSGYRIIYTMFKADTLVFLVAPIKKIQ
jgi:hypothetical protein